MRPPSSGLVPGGRGGVCTRRDRGHARPLRDPKRSWGVPVAMVDRVKLDVTNLSLWCRRLLSAFLSAICLAMEKELNCTVFGSDRSATSTRFRERGKPFALRSALGAQCESLSPALFSLSGSRLVLRRVQNEETQASAPRGHLLPVSHGLCVHSCPTTTRR